MQRPLAHPFRPFARTLIVLIVAFCVLGFFAVVLPVEAQETAFEQFGDASTLPQQSIAIIIARVIRVALTVVGIIFVCLMIYTGFLYLLARGEPEPIKKAKKIFQQSIIGLIIIFSAYSIVTFILNRLLDAAFGNTSASVVDAYSEPLSGSLGGGILDDHYPERDATEIPRNTRIFVTFKEAIDPASMISGYDENPDSTNLNSDAVLIYPTDEGAGSALASDEVVVTYDEDFEIFVFDPIEYLGSSQEDTNYTVTLTTDIERASGISAFTGAYASGYSWTFEVSTEIDLTPPYVTSIIPAAYAYEPRNVTVEINFSEAMDPVASTGSYITDEDSFFTNIQVLYSVLTNVEGTFEISNAYRTISFTTTDACGEDPCGDTIYCLPTNQLITAIAKAATLKEDEIPQAEPTGYTFDGVVDAAANSLGDISGESCGSGQDDITCDDGSPTSDYEWSFTTNDEIEDTVPQIITGGLDPEIEEAEISTSADVEVTFNTYLKSSTVNTISVSLWPDPYYEFWFAIRKSNDDVEKRTTVLIEHPSLVSTAEGGWDYWPVLNEGIKSAYQICMYPAIGPEGPNTGTTNACTEGRDLDKPYCCNGIASENACQTQEQETIEESPVPEGIEDYELPGNIETEP
ncbi:MAG: Ig-like domain-containing protein [Candidatus Uhrbacteria bacterium]|nr:Ig-like domain-containing protein [Candidatus Uhrbacteria bacterium]